MNNNAILIRDAVHELRNRIHHILRITETLVELNADMFSALFIRDWAALRNASDFEAIFDAELDYYMELDS
jgi:hypothetical protein